MPRFWHGMRFSTWVRLLWRNRFAIAPSRLHLAVSISVVSALNSIGGALEEIFLDAVKEDA